MSTADRYTSAIRSRNLRPAGSAGGLADVDVLGAAGFGARRSPIGLALLRLYAGDGSGAESVVQQLASRAWGHAKAQRVKLKRTEADDIARSVLAWHCDGACKACSGRGFKLVGGAAGSGRGVMIGDEPCHECGGARRVPFASTAEPQHRAIALWMRDLVEREQAVGLGALSAAADQRL